MWRRLGAECDSIHCAREPAAALGFFFNLKSPYDKKKEVSPHITEPLASVREADQVSSGAALSGPGSPWLLAVPALWLVRTGQRAELAWLPAPSSRASHSPRSCGLAPPPPTSSKGIRSCLVSSCPVSSCRSYLTGQAWKRLPGTVLWGVGILPGGGPELS